MQGRGPTAGGGVPGDVAGEIQRLRQQRSQGRPRADLSISGLVQQTAVSARRHQSRLGELVELWHQVIPAALVDHTEVAGLRGGVLEVTVDSAPVLYELDRHLRDGGTAELRRRHRGSLVRVRLKQGKRPRASG